MFSGGGSKERRGETWKARHTFRIGSNFVPSASSTCNLMPGSRAVFGAAGPIDLNWPLGEYFGI